MLIYDATDSPMPGDDHVNLSVPSASFHEISLRANPQNGYLWYLDKTVTNGLSFSHDTMEPLSKYRGTIQHFFFDNVDPGNYMIKLLYKRSWEKNPYSTKTFTVTIT